jgi:hypothetical protein
VRASLSNLRSLDPGLSRSVWTIQVGSFANAFGNGMVSAHLLIYLHNVRGIGLGTAGLCGVSERGIGLIFLANTLVIVVCQLPIAKLLEGRRRMGAYAVEAAPWASAWLIVFAAGLRLGPLGAALAFALAVSVFGIGECFHGTVRGAFLADLAEPALIGRYLALAAVSFQIDYSGGRAVGGFLLAASPLGLWLVGAGMCVCGSLGALALERRIPHELRRTLRRVPLVEAA